MALLKPLVAKNRRPTQHNPTIDVLAGAGKIIQVVTASISTEASTTSKIPADDTIPQNTEGAEFTTLSITPINPNSDILVEFNTWGGANASTLWIMSLFKDSTADAVCAVITEDNGKASDHQMLRFVDPAVGSSAITYKIRFGPVANSRTIFLLRTSATDLFGTAKKAVFSLFEVAPLS